MATVLTLDNALYKLVKAAHTATPEIATVKAGMFGGIMVDGAIGSKADFFSSVSHIGLTHIRWPGGSLAEDGAFALNRNGVAVAVSATANQDSWLDSDNQNSWNFSYDLSYPELMNPLMLAPNGDRASLTEMFTLARQNDASFELILPTTRYTDFRNIFTPAQDTALYQRAGADVAQLLQRIFINHQFGVLPKEVQLDLGNEGLVWSRLDPGKKSTVMVNGAPVVMYDLDGDHIYERTADSIEYDPVYVHARFTQYFGVITQMLQAVQAFRQAHPEIEFKIAMQLPSTNDDAATDNPQSQFLSNLSALPRALTGQIDMVRAHSLDRSFHNGAVFEDWYFGEIQNVMSIINSARAAISRPGDLEINISAFSSNGEDAPHTSSSIAKLHAAASAVAHMASLVELGADYASYWGVGLDYSDDVQISHFDHTYGAMSYSPVAEVLRQMQETIVGTKLLANNNYIDRDAIGPINLQAFSDDAKIVIFVSANDIAPEGELVTINMANFGATIGYAWAESITLAVSSPNYGPDEAAVWNPMIGNIGSNSNGVVGLSISGTSVSLRLTSDYEMVRLVVSRATPGLGELKLIGNSRAAFGVIDDQLVGGASNDTLIGLSGNDTLADGAGNDFLDGGIGDDIFNVAGGADTVIGGAGIDTLTLTGSIGRRIALAEMQSGLLHYREIENLIGGGGADTLLGDIGGNRIAGGFGNDVLWGNGGNDVIIGNAGNDLLVGGDGSDTLIGNDGADSFDGGAGNDSIDGGIGDDIFTESAGIDTILGGAGVDTLVITKTAGTRISLLETHSGDLFYQKIENVTGGLGNDTLFGDSKVNILSGGAGNDSIYGYKGNDILKGGAGNDFIQGNVGNDVIFGDAGNDFIYGGAGVDNLSGGLGSDIFVFASISETGDKITDFGSTIGTDDDRFHIRAAGFTGNLVLGAVAASQFVTRTSDNRALDANDRFIFRVSDKTLWFDANGNAAGGVVLIADLQDSAANLTASDIWII